jgi:hypothetical protein
LGNARLSALKIFTYSSPRTLQQKSAPRKTKRAFYYSLQPSHGLDADYLQQPPPPEQHEAVGVQQVVFVDDVVASDAPAANKMSTAAKMYLRIR